MPFDIFSISQPRSCRTGGFTFAGVITGLAATAAALVLGVLVTTRLAQRGVRQAEAAVAGLRSSIAGSLDSLGTQVAPESAVPDDPAPAWTPAAPEDAAAPEPLVPGPSDCGGPVVGFVPETSVAWGEPWACPRRPWPCQWRPRSCQYWDPWVVVRTRGPRVRAHFRAHP